MKLEDHVLLPRIEEALDSIRPFLEADGGNVEVSDIKEDNTVVLRLLGACGSCPMSMMTLKAGVEQALKRAIPEITAVEALNITDFDDPEAVIPDAVKERMG
jgi:Fe-S cluster biogenesis protein NfuA